MDKDEFFRILEENALIDIEAYLSDSSFAQQNYMSQLYENPQRDSEFEDLAKSKNEDEDNRAIRIEKNAIKYYE